MKQLYFLLFITLINTGCATNEVKYSGQEKNVITFAKKVVKDMSSKLDKLVTSLGNSTNNFGGYTQFHAAFFPTEGGIEGVKKKLFKLLCWNWRYYRRECM